MDGRRFVSVGLLAGNLASAQRNSLSGGQSFYKSEDDALFEAIRRFEAQPQRPQDRTVPVPDPGHDPENGVRRSIGQPADVAYADVYDFQVTGKWAL